MRFSIAALALPIGFAVSQGVTSAIAPKSSAPAGCSANYNGQFQIEVVNVTKSKRDVTERADGELIITLANGILTDSKGRTGYIAANQQFQFDAPAQTGAIYTAGWSVCANGSLAIGNDAIFYQCLSGTFYNLYDENVAAQCSPIYINVISASAAAGATILPDGQVTAAPVSQISDGQPQATTGAPVTQISDGQPQAATSKASASPITQISDGQIQGPKATTSATSSVVGAPVTVISDGQPQVPTGRNSTITSATRTASGTASAVSYTGAAVMPSAFFGLAAGALAVAML